MQKLLQKLGDMAGKDNVFTAPGDLAALSTWALPSPASRPAKFPLAAVRPCHPQRLLDLLSFAAAEGLKVCIRGGGTTPAPNIEPGRTLLILTNGLNRIIDIDATNREAIVQGGVTCADLAQAASRKGLFHPIQPGSAAICTIGGCIATNATGPRTLKYGSQGDYVRELTVVTPARQTLQCASQNGMPGNLAPSLPLANLFCGSMGTLGIISQAKLRLLPAPAARLALVAAFPGMTDAAGAVCALMNTRLEPSLLEMLDPACATLLGAGKKTLLLVEFDGEEDLVSRNLGQAQNLFAAYAAETMRRMNHQEVEELLNGIAGIPAAISGKGQNFLLLECRTPVAQLPEFVAEIQAICASHKVQAAMYGHVGVTVLRVAIFCGENPDAVKDAARQIFTLELMLNDLMKDEEEAALNRGQWQQRQEGITAFSRELRTLVDPAGLLSPAMLPEETNEWLFAPVQEQAR